MTIRNVCDLKGVGLKRGQQLGRLGIETTEDLILYFPRKYQDRRTVIPLDRLETGNKALVKARVLAVDKSGLYGKWGKKRLKLTVTDDTGLLEIVFFNGQYIAKNIHADEEYYFYGEISTFGSSLQMVHPEFTKEDIRGILPIYPLTAGLSQAFMRNIVKEALAVSLPLDDYMPKEVIRESGLVSLDEAVKNIHFPEDEKDIEKATKRLIYDEMYILQLGLSMMKSRSGGTGVMMTANADPYIESLEFPFTGAQKRVWKEISEDMDSARHMNRLLQGDVGSGKTVIAETAMFKAVKSGYQAVLMAPTEILAAQHHQGIEKKFRKFGINTVLLGGRLSAAERADTLENIRTGEARCIIGTHAVLQPSVEYENVGLVITDEQHRFGVDQRVQLFAKGNNPDILTMTATPIPRTLAVVYFGDMDVSELDEMPPGRQKILTKAVTEKSRSQVYRFVEEEIAKGRQIYVVCPLIEGSDEIPVRSAQEVYDELSGRLPAVGLLHGAMNGEEKSEVMSAFAANEIKVLVSTVVIEVGINVPNATVMVVENAERFGLAQLHQLRGRVGRGREQSYCLLILGSTGEIAVERARTMVESTDGFYIAERDLALRGPGEIFGNRQHGLPDLRLADISKNIDLVKPIQKQIASGYVNEELLRRVKKLFGENGELKL